jgi:hypothetical protein
MSRPNLFTLSRGKVNKYDALFMTVEDEGGQNYRTHLGASPAILGFETGCFP